MPLLWGPLEGRLDEWDDAFLSPKDTLSSALPTGKHPGTCSGARGRDWTVQALATRSLKPALPKLWDTDTVEYYAARKKQGSLPLVTTRMDLESITLRETVSQKRMRPL